MRRQIADTQKPYVVPSDNPTAEALIRAYWWDVSRHPLLLANLRKPDGSLYLPKGAQGMTTNSNDYTHPFEPESERVS